MLDGIVIVVSNTKGVSARYGGVGNVPLVSKEETRVPVDENTPTRISTGGSVSQETPNSDNVGEYSVIKPGFVVDPKVTIRP
jgi:hypothetical protein